MKKQDIFDLIIKGGFCHLEDQYGNLIEEQTDIGVVNGKIKAIESLRSEKAKEIFVAKNLHVLPGLIDTQVHFREPGDSRKENFFSGTKGAVLGGITSVFEMPNTNPPTIDQTSLENKVNLAKKRAWCDYAFFIGADKENIHKLKDLEQLPACSGVKVFMGSSTGSLLVSESELLDQILKNTERRIAFHCEDEKRLVERKSLLKNQNISVHLHPVWRDEKTALIATEKIVNLSLKHKHPVHILHLTTKAEVDFLAQHKKPWISVECTPQHLSLKAPECYDIYGTYAQMNPPIRSLEHQEALWKAINSNLIDVIGSDHAPHTREEKEKPYPKSPSGLTGVQTSVPLMLNHVAQGKLSLKLLIQLMSARPARLYKIKHKGAIKKGLDADFTLVDLKKTTQIKRSWIASPSAWTVFDGWKVTGWPVATMIRGHWVMRNDQVIGQPIGKALSFSK